MRYTVLLFLWIVSSNHIINAQGENLVDSNAVVTNSFGNNWYAQIGADMNLIFAYGHDVTATFPNGKSFGVDLAIGKWFSPDFGGRFKLNWVNGIFKNNHNTWLRPQEIPGENHRKGGIVTFVGDIQWNLHNLLGEYQPDRKWNLTAGLRAGGLIDIGTAEGGPVLGVVVGNSYRLKKKWKLFADVGFHFVSSIVGSFSGNGHGSNNYAEILFGVEMDLSKSKFCKLADKNNSSSNSTILNSFWDNWFGQVGFGMSLLNPYGTNFANVFPNGSTMGIQLGLGKWFSPEAGVRAGLNWQNGLIGNGHASYLDLPDQPGSNKDKHGYAVLYADAFFNLHNIINGYEELRKWNAIIYPRMGIVKNFSSTYEESPVLGFGTEHTYKINDKLRLYADISYQVTTSGFLSAKYDTGETAGSNGWFDLNIGIQYDFGKNWWEKTGERRVHDSRLRVNDSHNWPRFIVNTIGSVGVAYVGKTALKAMIKEERPDHSDNKSFPSGHAAMAFAAARSIDKEFRKESIWIPIVGYAAATAIGIERVASDRHHWYDVVAGAALGYGAAELTWWLSDKMFGTGSNIAVGSSGNTVDVVYNF